MRTASCRLSRASVLVCGSLLPLSAGCQSAYVTPGAGVNLQAINDYSIEERFRTKPASPFPARLAVVRVQQPGYRSCGNAGYGTGRYSVVTTRDIEPDEQFDRLASLPQVAGLATLNRLLLPENLTSIRELRLGAASLHTDMILLYTLDTSFNIRGVELGPLSVVTLGFLPNKKA